MKMGEVALKYLPEAAALWFNIANVRGKLEQWEESEQCFLTAIRLDGREARYHLNLGQFWGWEAVGGGGGCQLGGRGTVAV